MIGLIQRVRYARVRVAEEVVGEIGPGLLALIGIEKSDTPANGARLLSRILGYRVFYDDSGRMNRSLADTLGGLLLVSQFTLVADTQKGTRPSFSSAAPPSLAQPLFDAMVTEARLIHPLVGSGVFGADMQVELCNDGPVTFWLEA